ncbi:hypothetical protein HMJ29_09150 [Hymenobacter taeanensis]|uniref:Two pore domain potassium channel family protein n=1 Tax=Hymenobacter taeanensis TaxID=2735321 RepID=A0A6M6BIF7_9BACT|nr:MULTISPECIES: hypothetical protein [Hymenobacter]QJX47093.1 hypothetical protein HMJ29_09150 [Hymenobacter taeanensis]UOQ80971.1 hypothetical protein MUN83_19515 [Hymenobacter sp. 5414T-23]
MLETGINALAFTVGSFMVGITVLSAIRSFVLPRNESVLLNNWVFQGIRKIFELLASLGKTYEQRDKVMALYAPVGLVALPIAWLGVVSCGYMIIYWALGEGDLERCYRISNSSLLTLGSEEPSKYGMANVMSYSEATLGLLLLTLLISYLPTIYQAFSRREQTVARLELRAGPRASAVELLIWLHEAELLHHGPQWQNWEQWFIEIEETHTSLPILSFFRSPQPGRSWITAADLILDAASLMISTVDVPRDAHLVMCLKAGSVAINRVSRFFEMSAKTQASDAIGEYQPDINPHHSAFRDARQQLAKAGIPIQADEEAAWKKYQELRAHYSPAVLYLAKLTMAPEIKPI